MARKRCEECGVRLNDVLSLTFRMCEPCRAERVRTESSVTYPTSGPDVSSLRLSVPPGRVQR